MARAYTKDFLIQAFASRYMDLGVEVYERQVQLATSLYDNVGKDKFREYASLDAEAIKTFKNSDLYIPC